MAAAGAMTEQQGRSMSVNTQPTCKIAILTLTTGATRLGKRIAEALPGATLHRCRSGIGECVQRLWGRNQGLVFVMATGIVVRAIAPLLKDKYSDPAVVVCDERGKFAISLLSGHVGGANRLASDVAEILGGEAVITTASDVLGRTPLDLWARELGLSVADSSRLTSVMARLVERGMVTIFSEVGLPSLPDDIKELPGADNADMLITFRAQPAAGFQGACLLYPRVLAVGIGCNRGTACASIAGAVREAFEKHGLSLSSIKVLASIDLKKNEQGLLEFGRECARKIRFFSKDELNSVADVPESAAVIRATGARGVAEPAAVLAAGGGRLLIRKMKWKDVTVAVALDASPWWE